jgi:RNA polymerase sigma factor (TIGR02999 family)
MLIPQEAGGPTRKMSVVVDDLGPELHRLWTGFVLGDQAARERLLSMHYDEFRTVARRVLNGDAQKLQIQPTDLAHEAAIRILRLDRIEWRDRTHFLALSAHVMRQVLMDEVRRFRAAKRQAPPPETAWVDREGRGPQRLDLEAFDQALTRLAEIDPELARIVEQRFFAGLTVEEIALASGQSESTVKRRWRSARAWLLAELGEP